MLSPLDLDRIIQALEGDVDFNPFSDETEEEPTLDPVARITEPPQTIATHDLDIAERTSFDERSYDLTTNTRREQRIADETFEGSTVGSPGSFQAAEAKFKQSVKGLTADKFVKRMLAKEGMEYEWGGTTAAGGFDCSGIIWRIMTNAGYSNYPRHSSAIYDHAKKISLKKAINTRGAILYTEGHIAISLGNGKTIEAKGEDYGVVIDNAHGRFKYGGILPELKDVGAKPSRKRLLKAAKSALKQGHKTQQQPKDFAPTPERVVDPLVSLPMSFASVLGEVQEESTVRPRTASNTVKAKGLGFVPKEYRSLFVKAGERYGLDPRLLASVAQVESGFDPKAVSSAGAQGIMQIMPLHGLENPFNARASIFKGAEILSSYMSGLGLRKGLAAYNAGPSNYQAGLGYADKVLAILRGRG